MATEFKLPDLGEGVESGDIVDVLVSEGEEIEADQDVIELETEKAVVGVPCPHAGKVAKIHVGRGDTVESGSVILTIESADAEEKEEPEEEEATADEEAEAEKEEPQDKAEEDGRERKEKAKEEEKAEREEKKAKREEKEKAEREAPEEKEPEEEEADEEEEREAPSGEAPARRPSRGDELPPPASPDTRRYARELGVDLRQVSGTGPGGRITKDDVRASVRQRLNLVSGAPKLAPKTAPEGRADRDAYGAIRRAPLSKIRRTIAKNMARSASTIPHVTNFDDADITELERIRKGSMADYVGDVKLTMMSFVIKAVALALKQHPMVNAALDLDSDGQGEVVYKEYVNIGVAVDTPRGLIVPVMRDVDRLSIPQIATELHRLADSVREGRFKTAETRGGTFTISNLGAIGGTYSTPIINPPEVAVLLLGRSRRLPVAGDDETLKVRLMMPLSISYDHRLVDGAAAARFLNEVKGYLEVPGRLLLAP